MNDKDNKKKIKGRDKWKSLFGDKKKGNEITHDGKTYTLKEDAPEIKTFFNTSVKTEITGDDGEKKEVVFETGISGMTWIVFGGVALVIALVIAGFVLGWFGKKKNKEEEEQL